MTDFCVALPPDAGKLLRAERKRLTAILARYNARPNTDLRPFAHTWETYYLTPYRPWPGNVRLTPSLQKKFPNLFARNDSDQYFLNRLGLQALAELNTTYGIALGISFYNDWLHPQIFAHRLAHGMLPIECMQILGVIQERILREL